MTRRSIAATALGPFLLLVAALAAPAAQAGGGCHGNDGSVYTEGDGNTVIRMDVCSFSPTINRVPIGATVRFLNTSNVEHAVAGRAGTWGSAILPVGTEFSRRSTQPGRTRSRVRCIRGWSGRSSSVGQRPHRPRPPHLTPP